MAEARRRVWVRQPLFDDNVERLDAYFDVATTAEISQNTRSPANANAVAARTMANTGIKKR